MNSQHENKFFFWVVKHYKRYAHPSQYFFDLSSVQWGYPFLRTKKMR